MTNEFRVYSVGKSIADDLFAVKVFNNLVIKPTFSSGNVTPTQTIFGASMFKSEFFKRLGATGLLYLEFVIIL